MSKLNFKLVNDTAVFNYADLMTCEPYLFETMHERYKVPLDLVENPYYGDEAPVIAIDHNLKIAFNTGFYDPWNEGDQADIYKTYWAILETLIKQALAEY